MVMNKVGIHQMTTMRVFVMMNLEFILTIVMIIFRM